MRSIRSGFCIQADGVRVGMVTDLGYMPDSVKFHLRGAEFLLLESNHDIEMLKVGPYPWSVKQRVMGRNGHLSNDMVSQFILDGLDGCLKTLVLGHLSEHNNHPAIVHMSALQALGRRGTRAESGCIRAADTIRSVHGMITRYTRPEMGRIWSEENKYKQWLEVELAASEALAELGEVPAEAARQLRCMLALDAARIAEIERETRHDVIAFTTCGRRNDGGRRRGRGLALAALRADFE